MRINQVREILERRQSELNAEINRRMESGKTITEVCATDPFLTGRSYELGMLMSELEKTDMQDRSARYARMQ